MVNDDGTDHSQQYLANQRTFLSWLRTSIALIGLGFAIERFSIFILQFGILVASSSSSAENVLPSMISYEYSSAIGIGMVALGVGLIVYALKDYLDSNKSIARGAYKPRNKVVYTASLGLAGFGIVMLVFLISQAFLQ